MRNVCRASRRLVLGRRATGRTHEVVLDVLDGDGFWDGGLLLSLYGDTQLKLGLGLGCPVQLLIDGSVSRLQQDIGTSRVGVSLQNYVGIGRDVKEGANLQVPSQNIILTNGSFTRAARGDTVSGSNGRNKAS